MNQIGDLMQIIGRLSVNNRYHTKSTENLCSIRSKYLKLLLTSVRWKKMQKSERKIVWTYCSLTRGLSMGEKSEEKTELVLQNCQQLVNPCLWISWLNAFITGAYGAHLHNVNAEVEKLLINDGFVWSMSFTHSSAEIVKFGNEWKYQREIWRAIIRKKFCTFWAFFSVLPMVINNNFSRRTARTYTSICC